MRIHGYLVLAMVLLPISGCSTMDIYGHYQTARAKVFLSTMRPGNYFKDENQLALVRAARRCNADKVQALIEEGADPDRVGEEAMTPLTWMVVKQHYRGVECLLEAGATPDLQVEVEQGGQRMYVSALRYAVAMRDTRYMTSLLEHGAAPSLSISPVTGTPVAYGAILAGRKKNLEALVQYGFDVNHMSYSGVTPLRNAFGLGQYEIALWLLENGADPTLKDETRPRSASTLDFVERYGGRGMNIWSRRKLNAYNEFIDALIERGYLDEPPSHNQSE